eukprot:gb/GECH01010654.1/.p1 GENE.gb/GECH01010654.1/~~gb/GECH01010654.1/.p1  ORF type:complete len:125 (+),score=20.45 gb/GECH01010654.1/:1-375(+)
MSWQDYVDYNLLGTGRVKEAAMIGVDGSIWAASKDFNVSEAPQIVDAFKNPQKIYTNGIWINEIQYFPLRVDDSVIYAKKNKKGVAISKTEQSIIIGVYDENIQPASCNATVEGLADFLRQQGL